MEIAPGVHLIPDIIANPYLIVDTDSLTLIDTGLPGSHKKILRYISERGYSPADLRRIIITHSDMDHVGGLAALKRATSARVFASPIEAAAIGRGVASRQIRSAKFGRRLLMSILRQILPAGPVEVDEILHDGQTIPILGGLRVLDTPGHTPGHISLFSPSTGILFVGDSIVSRPEGLVSSIPANTWDLTQAADSVRKQVALAPILVCSGHGPVVKDAASRMPVL